MMLLLIGFLHTAPFKCLCAQLLLGCRMAIPVGNWVDFSVLFFLFFSVSVKVLPVTPVLSSVFVHRALVHVFLMIERVVGNA